MTIFYNLFSWEKMIRWSHVVSTMIDDDLAPQRDRSQKTKFMGPTWGPLGSCRPQICPMLAPWTSLSGAIQTYWALSGYLYTCNRINSLIPELMSIGGPLPWSDPTEYVMCVYCMWYIIVCVAISLGMPSYVYPRLLSYYHRSGI